ncbi:MvdC/MvdD family ATP grasp protein [Deinococcus indicus]|uniref:MvdC/MvdD family ATP grasp protein n=1 Tax=Deinococcus indicus TaxID=223556 RepID=UPI00117856FA|nr:hypothetical protein [Deinococcus indicus]
MKKIVIVTCEEDTHADFFAEHFNESGIDFFRLNTDRIHDKYHISHDNFRTVITNVYNEKSIDLDRVSSIWWRRPTSVYLQSPQIEENLFADRETKSTIRGLLLGIDTHWVSHPDNIDRAERKIDQLRRAHRMGFNVPRTVITNRKSDVIDFINSVKKRIIYKTLCGPSINDLSYFRRMGFKIDQPDLLTTQTTILTKDIINQMESVQNAPILVQEYIEKDYELRVTVIGNDVFSCRIDSQSDPETMIDWRNYQVEIPHSIYYIPEDLADLCRKFVKSYKLNYSALDIIKSTDGKYYFVENNPNGQFLWVECHCPEIGMTPAMTNLLLNHQH